MKELWIILGVLVAIILLVLTISFVCFYVAFYVTKKVKIKTSEFSLPEGDDFEKYSDLIKSWHDEVIKLPYEEVTIKTFDGKTLYGKYYEYNKNGPIEIMFHGYRGSADRDLCGGIQRAFALKRNVLIVDQRASGKSDGKVITFGIKESKDCIRWINYVVERFGKDVKIIITGISMGATTVMLASASEDLPKNVVGVIADCGFSEPKGVIKIFIKKMKLPPNLCYPFVRLGGWLFAGIDIEKDTALKAMKNCKVPIIFFHGEKDDVVLHEDSVACYEACVAPKKLVSVPEASHGLSYVVDPDRYLEELFAFEKEMGIER